MAFTRYSLNSLKHQLTNSFKLNFSTVFDGVVSYRYVERTDGVSHNLFDGELRYAYSDALKITLTARNIFNEAYSETNGVPMPKGTVTLGLSYSTF